ncbi:aldo/keto reductase [Pseudomonas mosselii]|uniref:aldo/keto reductase n=1 Tax=Pseudomonas mosselii TaxID=78327 RepID=UPI0016479BFE|nr:aldo/keto reductase [Pseudomonas mosselii]MBC3451317.1 aldo/keto reductase [Pseudomonas mosselii]
MTKVDRARKTLVLGTALWGWGLEEQEAYRLLDAFVEQGGRLIDTATNYPINKCPSNFGLAIRWIEHWLNVNGHSELSVIAKIGAVDNTGTPNCDLSPANISATGSELRERLGNALYCLSVHWDNRGGDAQDVKAIEQTLTAMLALQHQGLELGLSGIKHPQLYRDCCPAMAANWLIQVKENVVTRAARAAYAAAFPDARYLAYGINLGGIKNTPATGTGSAELRNIVHPSALINTLSAFLEADHGLDPRPATMNELALAFTYANPALCGAIIGPRNTEQLTHTMTYWASLNQRFDAPTHRACLSALSAQLENH